MFRLVEKAQKWVFGAYAHVDHDVCAFDQRTAQRVVTLLEHAVLGWLKKRYGIEDILQVAQFGGGVVYGARLTPTGVLKYEDARHR